MQVSPAYNGRRVKILIPSKTLSGDRTRRFRLLIPAGQQVGEEITDLRFLDRVLEPKPLAEQGFYAGDLLEASAVVRSPTGSVVC